MPYIIKNMEEKLLIGRWFDPLFDQSIAEQRAVQYKLVGSVITKLLETGLFPKNKYELLGLQRKQSEREVPHNTRIASALMELCGWSSDINPESFGPTMHDWSMAELEETLLHADSVDGLAPAEDLPVLILRREINEIDTTVLDEILPFGSNGNAFAVSESGDISVRNISNGLAES